MQQQLLTEHQDGGQFVRDDFSRVEMSGVKADGFAAGQAIAHIEFMRSDNIAL
ncbi:hypothetical protein D3C86_1969060 [compost metagenome]